MTTPTLAAMLVAALSGAIDVAPLVQEIQQHNCRRIAVCPRPIITSGETQTSVDDIALGAAEQIEQITQQLQGASRGSFEIVDSQSVFEAIKGMTIDSLSDADVRREIGQRVGADTMVFFFVEENSDRRQWDLLWKVVRLQDSTVVVEGTETLDIILSDAAYMGESFELRRWGRTGLEAVGFDSEMPFDWAMGIGPEWERLQYARLNRNQQHPQENPQLPYGVQLIVNGRPMAPERICDKLYVPIDPSPGPTGDGPDIGIRMFNHCGRKVYMAVYIDGLNMINQVRELPITTPTRRHWAVRNGYDSVLRSWFHITPGEVAQKGRFELVEAPLAVAPQKELPPGTENRIAYGDRIDDRLGMITCMVYTDGFQDVPVNTRELRSRSLGSQFAFGEGYREDTQIRWEAGHRGIMLAAMTIHYRTPQELDQIRKLGCEQLAGGATVVEELDSTVQSQPPASSGEQAKPGEKPADTENALEDLLRESRY